MKTKSIYAALSAALLAAGCASERHAATPDVLRPAANESHALTVAAKGVQIYECRAAKGGAGYEWTFLAPEADLLDSRGRIVGRHGAGPYWQANDGSRIVGKVVKRADAPIAGAIPWLLLASRGDGPEGTLSRVTSIQRVNTEGGLAPASGCSAETSGQKARIAYTADYRFFTSK